jgi:hypothetical protein
VAYALANPLVMQLARTILFRSGGLSFQFLAARSDASVMLAIYRGIVGRIGAAVRGSARPDGLPVARTGCICAVGTPPGQRISACNGR